MNPAIRRYRDLLRAVRSSHYQNPSHTLPISTFIGFKGDEEMSTKAPENIRARFEV